MADHRIDIDAVQYPVALQRLDQQGEDGRGMAAVRVIGVMARQVGSKSAQHANQAALVQIVLHLIQRQIGQPVPFQRGIADQVDADDGQAWKPDRETSRTSQSQLTGQMWRCLAMKANLISPRARKKP